MNLLSSQQPRKQRQTVAWFRKPGHRPSTIILVGLLVWFGCLALAPGLRAAEPAPIAREIWQDPQTGMEFTKVLGGCFQMGQNANEKPLLLRESGQDDYKKYFADEVPQHEVCVDEFWMGIHEVTQAQWQKLMGFNPSVFPVSPDHPVEMVSWEDAMLFVNRLNELNNTTQFRLPSEAEWEYAARAGATTMFSTGDTISGQQANFNGSFPFGLNLRDEYRKTTTAVGSFPPNAFGLYDMHGNVWEWCNDWYQESYYAESPGRNPMGPETGSMKVLRGGSWFRYVGHIRLATRYKNKAVGQYGDTGFRLVKSPIRFSGSSGRTIYFDQDF